MQAQNFDEIAAGIRSTLKHSAMTPDEIAGTVDMFNAHIEAVNAAEKIRPAMHDFGYHRGKISYGGAILRVPRWRCWRNDELSRAGFLRSALRLKDVVGGAWDHNWIELHAEAAP
jgi:hypothetical protein